MQSQENFTQMLYRAIRTEIEEIVLEESKAASAQVEKKVRERCTAIAGRVLQHFSMERFGHEVRITINFENTNKTP